MLSRLKSGSRVVGAKQSRRAIAQGNASCVYLAMDADPQLTEPIQALCEAENIPVETVPSMKELGAACGISVGAAVATLLKEA